MKFRRFILNTALGVLLVMLYGCHGALKSTWDNFTAYYNTFYNARQFYKAGIQEVRKQRGKINPERPINIYQTPVNISQSNFDQAIQKSADVLRNHPRSQWVDNALFLIGRSYFYEMKYYSADQKFQELYNTTNNELMQQRSIFWQGRVAYEMGHYSDGINLLNMELSSGNYKWNKYIKAEAELIEAELYIQSDEWNSAEDVIAKAIPYIKNGEVKARAYFLQGQILEHLGKLREAYNSYYHVHDTNPEYNLVYNALLKQAEVAREEGRLNLALKVFTNMSRDDKNFDVLPQLQYQIARTLEAKGKYKEAQSAYNHVLHNGLKTPDQETKAKIYYGLGDIYRHYYKNLTIAAAYFDSSASEVSDAQKLPRNFNAAALSKSFGEYAKLKKDVNNLDSLLWLGNLPKQRLDSVIEVIRNRKIEAIKKEMKAQQSNNNTMVNVNAAQKDQQNNNGNDGFLNYKNPQLVAEASQAFRAIWGNRPLVDNWRRIQAVRQTMANSNTNQSEIITKNTVSSDLESTIKVDLSKIPVTTDAKEKVREEIAKREYEIGNVFFLSLNTPDSARKYYKKIIRQYHETNLAPQAMYSLSELNYVNGDSVKAQQWADSVITNYPSSIYALRLNKRYGNQISKSLEKKALQSTLQDSLETLYYAILDSVQHMSPVKSAELLRSYGLNHSVSGYAPDALMDAANKYADIAKQQRGYSTRLQQWISIRNKWNNEQESLTQLQDTARVKLRNPKISQARARYWKSVMDSTLKQPDMNSYFPYKGAYWDSTRVVLHELLNYFPNYNRKSDVQSLLQALKEPDSLKSKAKKQEGKQILRK